MNRQTKLVLLIATLAGVALVVAMFTPSANANRSSGVAAGDIAFVDVFSLIDRALMAEEMETARTQFSEQSTEQLRGLEQQMQNLQTQLSTVQQNDPNASQLYSQYQTLQYQIETASRQINEDYQALIARQISRAYGEIYTSANEIAAEQGYAFVFATRGDGELMQTDTITGITQEILARPLVTPPAGVDLTEQVRVQLGYPEETADVYDSSGQVDPNAVEDAGGQEGDDQTQQDEQPAEEEPANEDD